MTSMRVKNKVKNKMFQALEVRILPDIWKPLSSNHTAVGEG